MIFSGSDVVRIGIGVYVALWFICSGYIAVCLKKNPNVHKYEKWSLYSSVLRCFGWILGLGISILLYCILPDVYVVTQKIELKEKVTTEYTQEGCQVVTKVIPEETFHVDTYYVPFSYNGHPCSAFSTYLSNETDSTLALYYTSFFNGQYVGVSNIDNIEIINPQCFTKHDGFIHNKFDAPEETLSIPVPRERKGAKSQLTITLLSQARRDIERIGNKIEDGNELIQRALLKTLKEKYRGIDFTIDSLTPIDEYKTNESQYDQKGTH